MINFSLNKIAVGTKYLINAFCHIWVFSYELVTGINITNPFLALSSIYMIHLQGSSIRKTASCTLISQYREYKITPFVSFFGSRYTHLGSFSIHADISVFLLSIVNQPLVVIGFPVSFHSGKYNTPMAYQLI